MSKDTNTRTPELKERDKAKGVVIANKPVDADVVHVGHLEPTGFSSTEGLLGKREDGIREKERRSLLVDALIALAEREEEQAKPLTWRTGPVPEDFSGEAFVEIQGHGCWVALFMVGNKKGMTFPGHGAERYEVVRWLPLSDILNLIGGE